MTEQDPRNFRGKLDIEDNNNYLLFLGNEEVPRAIYMGARGEYDAYLDIQSGLAAGPLPDMIGPVTWEDWQTKWSQVYDDEDEMRGEDIEIRVNSELMPDPATGLTISDVQFAAYIWLCDWNYRYNDVPETRVPLIHSLLQSIE